MTGLLIESEREQLDLQRVRLEELLKLGMVSRDMQGDLEQLLSDIGRRLWELSNVPQDAGDRQVMYRH